MQLQPKEAVKEAEMAPKCASLTGPQLRGGAFLRAAHNWRWLFVRANWAAQSTSERATSVKSVRFLCFLCAFSALSVRFLCAKGSDKCGICRASLSAAKAKHCAHIAALDHSLGRTS